MLRPKQKSRGSLALLFSVIVVGSLSPVAFAADVSHGKMAGAIRSANYPCVQVLKIDSAGNNAWVVQCNSGKFNVSRDENGEFKVTQAD